MTNHVRFTCSVGDSTPRFANSIEQARLQLVTLNTIFSTLNLAKILVGTLLNLDLKTKRFLARWIA